MAWMQLVDVPVWQPDWVDPDRARPVGWKPVTEPIRLTRSTFDDDGLTVRFAEEVDGIELWRSRPLEIRASKTPTSKALSFSTLEFARKKTLKPKQLGRTVVVSYCPYSLDWFGWCRFKSVLRRSKQERESAIERLLRLYWSRQTTNETALWVGIDAITTDLFGNEDRHYARLRDFAHTDNLAKQGKETWESAESVRLTTKANRKAHREVQIGFGICDDFKKCREVIMLSPIVDQYLQFAQQGRSRTGEGGLFYLGAHAQTLCRPVMEASIIQALAGPPPNYRTRLAKRRDLKKHGDVAILATWIFVQAMQNLTRRERSGRGQESLEIAERTTAATTVTIDNFELPSMRDFLAEIADTSDMLCAHKSKLPDVALLTLRMVSEADFENRIHGLANAGALKQFGPLNQILAEKVVSLGKNARLRPYVERVTGNLKP